MGRTHGERQRTEPSITKVVSDHRVKTLLELLGPCSGCTIERQKTETKLSTRHLALLRILFKYHTSIICSWSG